MPAALSRNRARGASTGKLATRLGMGVTVDQFLKHLTDSGILSSVDVLAVDAQIPEKSRNEDARRLATDLVRKKKITLFQANALYAARPQGLTLGNYVLQEKIG